MCPEYPPCNIILQVGWLKFVCPGNRQFSNFQFLSCFSCNFRHRLEFEHLDQYMQYNICNVIGITDYRLSDLGSLYTEIITHYINMAINLSPKRAKKTSYNVELENVVFLSNLQFNFWSYICNFSINLMLQPGQLYFYRGFQIRPSYQQCQSSYVIAMLTVLLQNWTL